MLHATRPPCPPATAVATHTLATTRFAGLWQIARTLIVLSTECRRPAADDLSLSLILLHMQQGRFSHVRDTTLSDRFSHTARRICSARRQYKLLAETKYMPSMISTLRHTAPRCRQLPPWKSVTSCVHPHDKRACT